MPELHFHDPWHIGNTTAAADGASLGELMERTGHSSPGHSSPRAALIYLRATRERGKKIARGMGKTSPKARKGSRTQRAHKPANKA